MTAEEGKQLADSLGINFVESSAKLNNNREKTFFTLSEEIKNKISKLDENE